MKKTALLALLPSALLLAGCASPGTQPDNQAQEAEKFAQILESGASAFCTVTNLTDNTSTEMTVSGKKMKIVGADMSGGKRGTMINDSLYVYTWEEGQKTGFKMAIPAEVETADTTQDTTTQQTVDVEEEATAYEDETKYKMNCTKRSVADSEFAPPSDISFYDPSQMQNLSPQELQKLIPQQDQE